MTNTLKYAGVAIAGVVVGWLLVGQTFGGVYNQVSNTFREGLKAGTSDQLSIDADGDLTTSGSATFSGTVAFHGAAFHSGPPLSTSTSATATILDDSDIENYCDGSWQVTPLTGALTYTVPASSTLDTASFLPSAGDWCEILVENATSTENSNGNITIAQNTGVRVLVASSTGSGVKKTIVGSTTASIRISRDASTNITFLIRPVAQ